MFRIFYENHRRIFLIGLLKLQFNNGSTSSNCILLVIDQIFSQSCIKSLLNKKGFFHENINFYKCLNLPKYELLSNAKFFRSSVY